MFLVANECLDIDTVPNQYCNRSIKMKALFEQQQEYHLYADGIQCNVLWFFVHK